MMRPGLALSKYIDVASVYKLLKSIPLCFLAAQASTVLL